MQNCSWLDGRHGRVHREKPLIAAVGAVVAELRPIEYAGGHGYYFIALIFDESFCLCVFVVPAILPTNYALYVELE